MTRIRYTRRAPNRWSLGLVLTCCLGLAACGSGTGGDPITSGLDVSSTGVLADIVIPDEHDSILPGANGVELSTPMDVDAVAAFFEHQMPSKGWTLAAPVTPKPNSAVVYFEQGARKATVHIRRPPGRDTTLVQVILG